MKPRRGFPPSRHESRSLSLAPLEITRVWTKIMTGRERKGVQSELPFLLLLLLLYLCLFQGGRAGG